MTSLFPASSAAAFCRLSQDGRISTASASFHRLFETTAEDLAQKSIFTLLGDPVCLSLGSGAPACDLYQHKDSQGKLRWLALHCEETADSDGLHHACVFDITAWVEAAENPRQIISAARLGTWEWKVPTGEVVFNARWAEMLGYTLAELSPLSIETWVKLVHPEDLHRSNNALAMHFSGHTPDYACECRLQHKDGHWVWVITRGCIISRMPDGTPEWVCGTHIDITNQKMMFEQLRESERAYQLAALASPSALYDWDIASDTVTWRGRAFEVMGARGNEELPMKSVDFQTWVHPEDHAHYRATLRRYFKKETDRLHDEVRLMRPDGTSMWVEYHGAALWDDKGRARRLFGSFTQINGPQRYRPMDLKPSDSTTDPHSMPAHDKQQ